MAFSAIDDDYWDPEEADARADALARGTLLCAGKALPADFVDNLRCRVALNGLCESDIEVDLGAALMMLDGSRFKFVPQFEIGRFRFDFAVERRSDKRTVALIECDGAAFHREPEQIENDRRKDAAAEAAGLILFRFTGREIYANPAACALSILRRLERL